MKFQIFVRTELIEGVGNEPLTAIDVDIAADPKKWASKSRKLWRSADLLKKDEETWLQAWMLYGLAIETALKGYLLGCNERQNHGSVNEQLKKVIRYGHNLNELAQKVMGADNDERLQKSLQFATECIEWRGKYPAPSDGQLKNSKEWKSMSAYPHVVLREFHEWLLKNLEP